MKNGKDTYSLRKSNIILYYINHKNLEDVQQEEYNLAQRVNVVFRY